MSRFKIVFMDNLKMEVNAFNFTCAKVLAQYRRIMPGAKTEMEIAINERLCFRIIELKKRSKVEREKYLKERGIKLD